MKHKKVLPDRSSPDRPSGELVRSRYEAHQYRRTGSGQADGPIGQGWATEKNLRKKNCFFFGFLPAEDFFGKKRKKNPYNFRIFLFFVTWSVPPPSTLVFYVTASCDNFLCISFTHGTGLFATVKIPKQAKTFINTRAELKWIYFLTMSEW